MIKGVLRFLGPFGPLGTWSAIPIGGSIGLGLAIMITGSWLGISLLVFGLAVAYQAAVDTTKEDSND